MLYVNNFEYVPSNDFIYQAVITTFKDFNFSFGDRETVNSFFLLPHLILHLYLPFKSNPVTKINFT